MSGLAVSAGDADLSGALQGADAAAAKSVGEFVILLGYVAESLESCAANYQTTETVALCQQSGVMVLSDD